MQDEETLQAQVESCLKLLRLMTGKCTVIEQGDFVADYRSFATILLRVCLPFDHDMLSTQSVLARQDFPKYNTQSIQPMLERLAQSMQIHIPDNMQARTDWLEKFGNVITDWLLQQKVVEQIKPEDTTVLDRQNSLTNEDMGGVRDNEADLVAADSKHAEQLIMLSTRFTIWHCVSTFSSQPGNKDWELVDLAMDFLHAKKLECPWMRGDELGVFGETPLHIALLFNRINTPGFEKFFEKLWSMCPKLRAMYYQGKMYQGENVLHLAIIRNYGHDFIEHLLKTFTEDRAGELCKFVNQRAVGSFFKQDALSDGYCNLLGETPLCFAACSNQVDIFELLVKFGADVEVQTKKEGHNILHLMILNQKFMHRGEHSDDVLVKMYDTIADCVKRLSPKTVLETSTNKAGLTPRVLAAAEGSCKMFMHLFDDKLETAWSYGPLKCLKMYLEDVEDVGDYAVSESPTILATLVRKRRDDILSSSQIDRLVNVKWVKYGREVFERKFLLTVLFMILIFFLPMIQFQTTSFGNAMHFLSHIFAVYVCENICVKKVENSILLEWIFCVKRERRGYLDVIKEFTDWTRSCFFTRPDVRKWFAGIKTGATEWDLDLVFYGLAPLCLKLLAVLFICRIWIAPQAEYVILCLVACRLGVFVVFQLPPLLRYLQKTASPDERPRADFAQVDITMGVLVLYWLTMGPVCDLTVVFLATMESCLYLMLGFLSFLIVMSDITVLEKFGAFVFTLIRITVTDLPIFFTVYIVFLVLFAHAHFLGSNHLHAGVPEGIDSMWRIFGAMLGEFEDKSVKSSGAWSFISGYVVTGISVANYFLVTVVLVNVLIAMLSHSYEQSREEAKSLWKLHRASTILKIDQRMTSAQRKMPSKVFWHTSPSEKKTRFLTLTSVDKASVVAPNYACVPPAPAPYVAASQWLNFS